jgi:putative DNA primase/helicase
MAKMIRLDPTPKEALSADGWELIATEAGRYATGLRATIQLWNGQLQAVQQLDMAQPKSVEGLAGAVATRLDLADPAPIRQALLRLTAGVEGVLRQIEEQARSRPEGADDDGQGQAITFPDDDEVPWSEPVDGPALLESIAETYRRYLVLPTGGAAALALWTLHTHAHESSHISPILALQSPEKRCGKTTTLQILSGLVARALPCSNITPAAIFRTVERYHPTLVLDEADTYLTGGPDDLRGILNSGHTRATAYVIRTVGEDHEPRRFCTWSPKAIALIGRLPDTLADRSITLTLQRKTAAEHVERWRFDDVDRLTDLRRMAQRWAADHHETLASADPKIPDSLHDRAADNWRPLFAIADAAGGRWPEQARLASKVIEGAADDDEDLSILLLRDLQQIFAESHKDRLASEAICEQLAKLTERPWRTFGRGEKPLTPNALARLLRPFGIVSRSIRLEDGSTPKGYVLEAFMDSFSRYIPALQNATPTQQAPVLGGVAKNETPQDPPCGVSKMASNPLPSSDVAMWRFESGGSGRKPGAWGDTCTCGEVMPEGRKRCFACGRWRAR